MSQKIAIAVIHGIGKARPEFADPEHPDFLSGIAPRIRKAFSNEIKGLVGNPDNELVFEPIYWADVVQKPQDELYERLGIKKRFSQFFGLRDFIFHSLADSVAYQPTSFSSADPHIYEDIHSIFANSITRLAQKAGRDAPLCIIAHSMGVAVASNYIWDNQKGKFPTDSDNNLLKRGETFTSFYTFGSQLPFWAMRFKEFGQPIKVPSPELNNYHPRVKGEWINFYDRDDLLGYPCKDINLDYKAAVTHEYEVKVGGWLKGWNTFSHNEYWKSKQVTQTIASSLARLWKQINVDSPLGPE